MTDKRLLQSGTLLLNWAPWQRMTRVRALGEPADAAMPGIGTPLATVWSLR